ncbi:uncharacterized protein MONOS_13561 [Monocercomonoides exilis]|uniref:uncharacterized protein n=1 Tax=Monocercomonoides exilis TaxID=2049356 RepID=UPI00355A255A|nr:hypothetical protein MONOS_13561 [Monocercomonoides exilis]|eukprot:MONOS_13561.1-p1 / transcript=MONOS_13561.1 / gene=MONOS_13561 / organism=Monocercomonoides_exilis_PA203 / gene_product=unspecified product / transcript_product=unspecified product / location=Mono_scaffold00845:11133-19937(-) / protein_length=2935 / sequence_SO=supercontig / SO=protein_coding / is_pseudo=false
MMIKITHMAIFLSIYGISVCLDREWKESVVCGCVCACNSSIELRGMILTRHEHGSVMRGLRGSMIVMRGCIIGTGKDDEAGAFDLSRSIGVLTNITLKGWRKGGEIYSGRLFGGKGYGREKGGGEEKRGEEGERGRDRGREGDGDGEGIEGSISVSESRFSSFCVSSAPFLSSPSIPLMSLSHLTFFNISTANDACLPATATSSQTSCLMNSCSFSSVCNAYDGGIVPSLNNPLASLIASNTSFIGCCRTRNVEYTGTENNKKHPGRHNETENGANSFAWCEWNGSKTTGSGTSYSDGTSNGGAIFMYGLSSGTLSVKFCSFNDCYAHYGGGGIMCREISSINIENNSFNACTAQNYRGGGMYAYSISTCVRISGCEFQKCTSKYNGGGLFLQSFQVSGSSCIGTENGKGESACVFECFFTSCLVREYNGGGMYCHGVPASFKMRSVQFISCKTTTTGGGLCFNPNQQTAPSDNAYCYFFFFHDCRCSDSTPYGHDVYFRDDFHLFSSKNPFYESYTTNDDENRLTYHYFDGKDYYYMHTEKKWWLKDKTVYASVSGNDLYEPCGANESNPCLTVKKAFEMCEILLSISITLKEGNHISETTTIEIGEKKISVVGKGREACSIGTGALSSPSAAGALFSVTTGHLGLLHMKVDCNLNSSPLPSVAVVSDGSGSLSLEDVVITTSKTGNYVMLSSVFVVPLSQLSMVGVEIKDMNVSKPLFSEPDLSSSSSSSSLSSLSSSALYLTATASGDSVLANMKVMNVKLTEGDGVVVAKSVKAGETFVVKNVTIEDCECKTGSGGGIKVELKSSSKLQVETFTKFNRCKCSGYGGGIMLYLEDGSHDFSIVSVDFSGCIAMSGGNYVFVNGSNSASWKRSSSTLNVQHDSKKFNELVGYDRSDTTMGLFPLNIFLDTISGAAHVGKAKNNLGGYNSWFCGFAYYPCATITYTGQTRYSGKDKNIELDSGFELAEEVSMTDFDKEWLISCATKGMNVKVIRPSSISSDWLINAQSTCKIENITFSLPTELAGVKSLILANSTSITLTDCSLVNSPDNIVGQSIGYSFVNALSGKLWMEQFEIREGLTFDGHSLVEFVAGVSVVYFKGCIINSIDKKSGNGGFLKGVVGEDFGEGPIGIVVIESCVIKNCKCRRKEGKDGKGGGICMSVKGEGSVVVNGTSEFDGCEAYKGEDAEGRGGGIMLEMLSSKSKLEIASEVKFSVDTANKAKYGKDVFVSCGSGILLETKINPTSFAFIKPSDEISNDSQTVLNLCGSEKGNEDEVIPLFVYLFSIGSKLTVDGSGSVAYDHSYCGFEKFGCQTINYCMSTRVPKGFQTVEVSSESSINDEIIGPSFNVIISGRIVSSDGERMGVNVSDGGSDTQNCLVGCSSSLTMRRLSFVVKGQLNSRRSAFIHSTSTLSVTNCSISFESGALTDGKIGYSIIDMTGGELIIDGLMMEIATTLTMNGKSPISMTSGAQLEILNSRVNGVEVEGGSGEGRGCIGAAINEDGSAIVDNCSISTTCTGGSGMKGGGMMISVGERGSLEINDVRFSGCQVPTEDNLQKGRGMGGGMFVSLADTMESFVLEGVTFSECNAWKGKKMFISGNDLSEVMSNEKLKKELSTSDENSLDELCGWERASTGENGYVIPLVVYLWTNWSGNGFVSKEKGGDFSECGYSEAPCSSIDHLISLRYSSLGEGETHINIVGSGLLSHSISFLSSLPASQDSELPKVVIKAAAKETGVTITDEDEVDLKDSMISSNVSLSLANMSFTKPVAKTNHAVFIESSGTNALLTVTDCSFGSLTGLTETFGYCMMRVNGGSALIEKCTMNLISDLKGFISFSRSVNQVIVQKVNISLTTVTEGSLISIFEDELAYEVSVSSSLNAAENSHPKNSMPLLKVNGCSFANITNEGNRASVVDVGSFDYAIECMMDECLMTSCKSTLSNEGGGVKVVLKDDESVLKVNGSSFSLCKCSMESGRGGGLFIDEADPNVNCADATQMPRLWIKIVNIKFSLNEAFVGKDIFIKCHSIVRQISETLFTLDYNQESLNSDNSICGCDSEIEGIDNLIPRITYFKGLQVFVNAGGEDGRLCGTWNYPCKSINCGIDHIQEGVMNAILIDGEGAVTMECVIGDLVVNSFKKSQAIVKLKSKIEKSAEKDSIMEFINEIAVEKCSFEFEDTLQTTHCFILKVKNGMTKIQECEFFSSSDELKLNSSIVSVESGELRISETTFRDLHSTTAVLSFNEKSNVTLLETSISNIKSEGDVVSVGGKAKVVMKIMTIENVSVASERCVVAMEDAEQEVRVLNCSFGKCRNSVNKGSIMQIRQFEDMMVEACVFDGKKEEKEAEAANEGNKGKEGLCEWNGSLVDIENSNVVMKETTVMKSKEGGMWVSGGSVKIENSKFENNNPEVEGYPSARRNVICTGNSELNVASVKGGDGIEKNSSLWILDEGCQLGGIASERGSSFFIPVLEEVTNTTSRTGEMELIIHGKLLLPCNLSVKISMKDGNEEEIGRKEINGEGSISENEVHFVVSSEQLEAIENKTEVSLNILFGKGMLSSTNTLVVINKSEGEMKGDENKGEREGDERISEGGNKIEWSLVAFIGCIVIIVILLFVIIMVVVLMRKKQNGGRMRVEDGDIEEPKNAKIDELRTEDIAERVEEEKKMQTPLADKTGAEMKVSSNKGEEMEECENKEMVENSFDCEEVMEVAAVNLVEIHTVPSLICGGADGSMEGGAYAGGKEDENISKRDRKAKNGKGRKGKKRKQIEEVDEIGDERGGSEIGLEEFGGVAAADDGRNGKPTEYYIGICSAPNSHFSMIGEDSEEQGMKKMMEEERKVVKEGREEEREEEESVMKEIGGAREKRNGETEEAEGEEMMKECEGFEDEAKLTDVDGCMNGEESSKGEEGEAEGKRKRRKKKKRRNQKREDKSEIVRDIVEMGSLDSG